MQGCYRELQRLLKIIGFKSERDHLWFVGDLVNRGPASAEVLRFVRNLGNQAVTVLGNHDLHLLALANGVGKPRKYDTFYDVLNAPDRENLLHWLCQQPLLYHDQQRQVSLVHAGLSPKWDLPTAMQCAREAERCLRDPGGSGFFQYMYGNKPNDWATDLKGWGRIRYIVNCFSRIRYCDHGGRLTMREKGHPCDNPDLVPWFRVPGRAHEGQHIVFGHWSTLGFVQENGVICLDTGCLWGGCMTAWCLDTAKAHQLECDQKSPIR